MRANFDNKLSELNKKLLSMAAMTEQIIAMSIKSLEEQNTKLARETVEFDAKINEAEREVERICLNLLLQQQPVFAEDLRRCVRMHLNDNRYRACWRSVSRYCRSEYPAIKKKQKWDLSDISEMARALRSADQIIMCKILTDEEIVIPRKFFSGYVQYIYDFIRKHM